MVSRFKLTLSSMVSTCKAAGVDVIVDTVLNHMTGTDSGEHFRDTAIDSSN